MKKLLGIFGLFVFVFVATALLSSNFLGAYNLQNLINWFSLYGIISIGAMFVIITGGIDLSIGSLIGLIGSLLSWMLMLRGWSEPVAVLAVLGVSLFIGLAHGLLITKLRLQPFVVTLCGLLIYRGLARHVLHDSTGGFEKAHEGLRSIAIGKIDVAGDFHVQVSVCFLVGIAIVAAIFLNRTI